MNSRELLVAAALAGGLYWWASRPEPAPQPEPVPAPSPAPRPMPPAPAPSPPPKPKPPLRWPQQQAGGPACPCGERCECESCICRVVGEPVEGGGSHAGVEVTCDLPTELRMKNVGGRDGAGLCVFTSIAHAARYQNETRLMEFQKQMRAEPGGGYPSKVDQMIEKYGKGTEYVQHQGGDLEFLYRALRSGRMPSVTYSGRDPHYGRQRVSHMVNLVHLDPPDKTPRLAAILDNNFPGENELVWMTAEEFTSRWKDMQGGWAVILLAPTPPPVPRN